VVQVAEALEARGGELDAAANARVDELQVRVRG
jgi:hypothetical protein